MTDGLGRTDYIYDTLDRSYVYDHVGRLTYAYSGSEARASIGQDSWGHPDGPYAHEYHYDVWGNITSRVGWGGWNASYSATFNSHNQMVTNPGLGTTMQYDAAGNMTDDGGQTFSYDATGAQVQAPSYGVWQGHDGDGWRVKNVDGGTTYYLRSTVLGGKVIAEVDAGGNFTRGYVYSGEQLVALQRGDVYLVHQDPVTKSQRLTDAWGNVVAAIELDPYGGETDRSSNQYLQPHRYTTWERNSTGDESLFRRYHGWWSRFAHPDPYDGSYDLTNPQSFNRYAYVKNDPVNFIDPTGLVSQEDDGVDPTKRHMGGFGGVIGDMLGSGSIFVYATQEWRINEWVNWFLAGFPSFLGGAGTGGGTGPQNFAQQQPLDDCHHFAQMLQEIVTIPANLHDPVATARGSDTMLILECGAHGLIK